MRNLVLIALTLTLVPTNIPAPYQAQPEGASSPDREVFYRFDDGDRSVLLLPFSDGRDVADFYSYGDPHEFGSNTGYEKPATLRLLLWSGPDGLSLVALINAMAGGAAGELDLEITGLPSEGAWVVQDDPATASDDQYTDSGASWTWADCCTDGGAFRGGLDGVFSLALNATHHLGLDGIEVLSASSDPPATIEITPGDAFTLDTIHRPLAPGGQSATAGPGARQITVGWSPPTDDGGAPVLLYRVYRDGEPAGTTNATSFTDTGLRHEATYTYNVSAINLAGEGNRSLSASATTWTVPRAPSVEADPGPGAVGEMRIHWVPPAFDGGTEITGYRIWEVLEQGERSIAWVGPVVREYVVSTSEPLPGAVEWAVSAENAVGYGGLGYGCGVWSPYAPTESVFCRY